MDDIKIYWVDEMNLHDCPGESNRDVAVCYQPAVSDQIEYWRDLYLNLKEELKKNSQDFEIEKKENAN